MLPAAASFKRQGANRGALASFLVSTPESGVDSIAITYALLDPIMTVVRPLAAFVTGLSAGILENSISYDSEKQHVSTLSTHTQTHDCDQKQTSPPDKLRSTIRDKLVEGVRYAFGDVWGDIVFWFFAGLMLAGIITVFIPEDLSTMMLGGGVLSMLAMLMIGMPVYICATASTPIAAALLLKGVSPGAVLVFLLAGPATNMTSLSVLIQILGKMGTLRYLGVIALVSILFGLGLDELYQYLAIEPKVIIQEAREFMPYSVKMGSAILLIIVSLGHVVMRFKKKCPPVQQQRFISGYPELKPARYYKHHKHHIKQK